MHVDMINVDPSFGLLGYIYIYTVKVLYSKVTYNEMSLITKCPPRSRQFPI